MWNKRTDCSNLKVAMQEKKGKKYVASVTDYDIPYMERPAIKGKTILKRSCQSLSFTRADFEKT